MRLKRKILLGFFSVTLFLLLLMIGTLFFYVVHMEVNKTTIIYENRSDKKEEENKVDTLTFIAAGDGLIHSSIYFDAATGNGGYDFRKQLDMIKPIVSQYDLAFYNQESIFGGKELAYSTYPRFNTPSEFGDAMLDAGFNMVALANNHSYDKGEKGVLNALAYWESKDIMYSGLNSSMEMQENIQIRTKNNISYALLSYTTLNNGLNTPKGKEYLVNYYSDEQAKKDIEALKGKVDLIIVSMHWGVEYSHVPNAKQKEIAKYLADLGVNIIAGHHPHVLQPIEIINDTVVIYSMGNFIASQILVDRQTGVLVSMTITKENNKISISHPEAMLTFTYSTNRWRQFKVIPYSELEEKWLKDHQKFFEEQKKYITAFDNTIIVK